MKKTDNKFAIAEFAILFFFSLSITFASSSIALSQKTSIPTIDNVPVIFGKVPQEHQSILTLDSGEDVLTDKDLGVSTTLFGKLHDTGAIDLFYAYWYDGRQISSRRYYVKNHIYKQPHSSLWVKVEATITNVDSRLNDKHEIQINTYHGLNTKEIQAIARASANSVQWLSKNLHLIDLNRFKDDRSKSILISEERWNSDFNKLNKKGSIEISSLDMKRGIAEIVCSRYVIEEVPRHHASYIDLVMVYDLNNDVPIRLIVRPNGYFLE